jgi:hypothetical protein
MNHQVIKGRKAIIPNPISHMVDFFHRFSQFFFWIMLTLLAGTLPNTNAIDVTSSNADKDM